MTGLPSKLGIDVARVVPPGAKTFASSVSVPASSTALTVVRPNALEVAERMRDAATTLDKHVAPLTHKHKPVSVITDWWGLPLFFGGAAALGLGVFAEVAAIVPWTVAGVGAALSTVGAIIHPKLRKQAADRAPPLLEGELRAEVLSLENASRSFAPAEGGRVEAPEVQVFVANRAKTLLAAAKGYEATNDADLVRVLERLAGVTSQLTPQETQLLELIELCIKASKSHDHVKGIPEAFAALSVAQQRELAPFVREAIFSEDDIKVRIWNEAPAYHQLHRTLETIDPKTNAGYPTKPVDVPAPVASHNDVVSSLNKLADFDELFVWSDRRHGIQGPGAAEKAVAFAIEDQHSGVERALFGIIAERHFAALRDFDFRLRAALWDVVATGRAEPAAVREEAAEIMQRVDGLAAAFRSSPYNDGIDVPGMSLRRVIALLELARMK